MAFNWLARIGVALSFGSRSKTKRRNQRGQLQSGIIQVEQLESRQLLTAVIANVETTIGSFAAGGQPVAVTSALTVSDSSSTTLTGATVTLGSTYRSGEDVLAFSNTENITGSFDTSTGTLTLSGTATLANYQAALRSITYQDTATDPTPNIRLVTFSVNDGTDISADAYRYINITPLISNVETTTATYVGGGTPTPVTNTLTLGTTASGSISGATVQIDANYVSGQDMLLFTNTPNITGSFNSTTGMLTLTGTDTVADYQSALRSITYVNTNNSPTTGIRRIAFTVDGATNSSFVVDRYFSITTGLVISGVETTPGSFSANGSPVAVTSTLSLSDPASTTLNGATVSLGPTYRSGEDVLAFTNIGNITGSFNTSTGTLTLSGTDSLANYQAALRSITYQDVANNPTPNIRQITITVTDGTNTSLTAYRYINIVSQIATPPVGVTTYTGGSVATPVTSTLTLGSTASGLVSGATVQIDANYVNGQDVLSFSNTANISGSFDASTGTLTLTGIDTVADYQAALRSVMYVDTNNNPTTGIRRFAFTVDGATNSSFAADSYFMVTGGLVVTNNNNDASVMADGAAVPIISALTVSDTSSATLTGATLSLGSTFREGEDLLAFVNTSNISGSFDAATGVLTLTGTDTVANYQAALRSVTYEDTSVNPTPNIRKLTISVTDGTNIANVDDYFNFASLISNVETSTMTYMGGSGAKPITNTLTLGTTVSGDLTGATVQISANYVSGQDVLAFTNTTNITGSFNTSTGTLTLSGTDTVANYQAALRSITYDNTSSTPTTGIRKFTFTVDGATNAAFVVDRYFSIEMNQVISNVESTPASFTADGSPNSVTSTLTVSDGNSSTLTGATIQIAANYVNGEDVLGFTNIGNISGSFDASTGILTLTGTDTLANYQAALRSVTYQDVSNNPTPNIRLITMTANDGSSISASVDRYISFVPLISNLETSTATYLTSGVAQAVTNTLTLGATASGLISGATVQINANYVSGEDVLSFMNTANISGTFNAATGMLTLTGVDTVADYQAALRSITYTNTSGNPTTGIRRFAFTVDGATNSAFEADRYFLIR